MTSKLFLRLDPGKKPGEYRYGEMFLVYDDSDRVVGRIYYESGPRPDSGSWFWMIDIYSWPVEHHPKEPHYGNVATKDEAMAAARRIWNMKP
jgi:hypothetical protein